MTFKTKLTTAIATGAVLINALAPIALAETITVTGNGAQSNNTVNVATNTTTVVNQTNNAFITNKVESTASTGGNDASFNTGGTTKIITGDAKTNVDVSTAVNLNKVDLKNCGTCDGGPVNVTISENGAQSENEVEVDKDNEVYVDQDNNAKIFNDVEANAYTGKNDASYNTGGDSIIWTGNATTNVTVDNKANANIATVGGGDSDQDGSTIEIIGNGAESDNDVDLDVDSAIVLDQYNHAFIHNDVDATAKTGKNDSIFNTGGITAIITGDAKSDVDVDNLVNFNAAKVDCDCILEDLEVKIGVNGAQSENEVEVDNEQDLFDDQDNFAGLFNDVDDEAKTGYNDVSFSTGDPENDPIISTGNSWSSSDVSNVGNVNLFNEGHSLHIPGDWEVGVEFDLEDLLDFLHLG